MQHLSKLIEFNREYKEAHAVIISGWNGAKRRNTSEKIYAAFNEPQIDWKTFKSKFCNKKKLFNLVQKAHDTTVDSRHTHCDLPEARLHSQNELCEFNLRRKCENVLRKITFINVGSCHEMCSEIYYRTYREPCR